MGVLIDTSVLIQIERSGRPPVSLLRSVGEQSAWLSSISASELLHGVHRANTEERRKRRSEFVEAALEILPVLPFDLEIARVHARLWAELSRRGELIGRHDLLIAATALASGHGVLTANIREFRRIQDLEVTVWPSI